MAAPDQLDALDHLMAHNMKWEGLQDIDVEAYRQAREAITALRAEIARLTDTVNQLDALRTKDTEEADQEIARLTAERDAALAGWVKAQCCMCGKRDLSTDEDGGPECELADGRWVCSRGCYEHAVEPQPTTVQDAAQVLLDAMERSQIDPFDAIDPEIEALAVKYAGNRGDAVIQLEIAEAFFKCALRAIAGSNT